MSAKLAKLAVVRLVQDFERLALQQDQALLFGDRAKVNALYWKIDAIVKELKSRSGDQRKALTPFLQHQNAQVRRKAAAATLAVAPREARQTLEDIVRNKIFPQALDAGMTLNRLDDGSYKPT